MLRLDLFSWHFLKAQSLVAFLFSIFFSQLIGSQFNRTFCSALEHLFGCCFTYKCFHLIKSIWNKFILIYMYIPLMIYSFMMVTTCWGLEHKERLLSVYSHIKSSAAISETSWGSSSVNLCRCRWRNQTSDFVFQSGFGGEKTKCCCLFVSCSISWTASSLSQRCHLFVPGGKHCAVPPRVKKHLGRVRKWANH